MTDRNIGPAPRDEPPHRRGRNTPFMITLGVVLGFGALFSIINSVSTIPRWEGLVEEPNIVAHYPILEQHTAVGDYPIDEDSIGTYYYSRKDPREAERRAQIAASGFKAADHLIVAVGALAEERGLTYAALKARSPFDPELQVRIGKLRQVSDGVFEDILRLMQANPKGYGWHASSTEVDRLRSLLDGERRRIDAGPTRQDAGVDVDLSLRWFQTTTRAIEKANAILRSIHQDLRDNSRQNVEASLHLQQIALLMAEYAGRERAIVYTALLRQTNLDDEPLYSGLSNIRMHIDIRWKEAKALARIHGLSPALIHLMSEIDRSFFEELNATRKIVEQASKAKSKYPITSEQWFQQVTKAIERMLKLGRDAGELAFKKGAQPHEG